MTFEPWPLSANKRQFAKMALCCGKVSLRLLCLLLIPACNCHPQGSSSSVCDVRGGQCPCRANVIGRRCDQCAPGTYGLGPSGCRGAAAAPSWTVCVCVCVCVPSLSLSLSPSLSSAPPACGCSLEGSASRLCDGSTGQCSCHAGALGKQCDGCRPGHWGFPNCRPCQCHGRAAQCDQRTGSCIACRANTGGERCQRSEVKPGPATASWGRR